MTCGGSIVALKRTARQRFPITAYHCAYHHKRGKTICTDSVEIRQDILDSAILHAMNEVLDERVLEASVTAALDRIRNEQEKFPDQRLALEGELSLIQTRLHCLVEAIASGRSTGKVFDSLNEVEARKKVVVQELSTRDSLDQIVSLDASASRKTSEAV